MSRQYRILGVVGRGGFGTVYRAKLLGDQGFEKDVALKLLKANKAKPKILARFRDEARMLGLARDRALVAVDPPIRIEDRWAVVMEFVDGVPLEQLLEDGGPLPVGVVVEVVREVARALDAVYAQRGPDGGPLKLLHRDLKPSNLQLTPTGEIKILDFGIARAEFAMREAKTLGGEMAGTAGYMAPERLEGIEMPSGDVFSLGRVMRRLLTGDRPVGFGGWREAQDRLKPEGTRAHALDLATKMEHLDPEERPSMRSVEDAAHALLRQCDDPPLRRWAELNVPPNRMLERDEWVGRTVAEGDGDALVKPPPPRGRGLLKDRIPSERPSPSRARSPLSGSPTPHVHGTPPPPRGRGLSHTPAPPRGRSTGRPSGTPPPPRGRAAPTPKPAPTPPPPAIGKELKTVKPKTLTSEGAEDAVPTATADPIDAKKLLPTLLVAMPLALFLGIALIIALAGASVRSAEDEAHRSERAFVDRVRLEAKAIGYSFERSGASASRVQSEVEAFEEAPDYERALELAQGWERLLTVLPEARNPREDRDRHELRRQIESLLSEHSAVVGAHEDWADSTEGLPASLAIGLGLASSPPES